MPSSGNWNGTSYSIPLAGELNWSTLSNFLIDLRNNAQTTNFQKVGARVATSSPVTVAAASDAVVMVNVAGVATVDLPAGATGQIFTIADTSGAAATNNITIDGNAAETINGSATYVLNRDNAAVTLAWNGTEWRIISESIAGGLTTGTGSAVLSNSPTFTGTTNIPIANVTTSLAIPVGATTGNVYSGVYTPTFTNGVNVTSHVAYAVNFCVVGRNLSVAGRMDPTVTAGGSTNSDMTCTMPNGLTIESSPGDVGGTMFTSNGDPGRVGENTSAVVGLQWYSTTTGGIASWFHFTVRIA